MGKGQISGRWRWGSWICALLAVLLFVAQMPAGAASNEETVRVAFSLKHGLAMIDEEGNRSGYYYELLQEIAQYTGWNYEFIDMDGSRDDTYIKIMEDLKNGEIDLIPGQLYFDAVAKEYDYSAYSIGSVYTVLAVLNGDEHISEASLFQYKPLRVAALEKANTRITELQEFCSMNRLELELVLCPDMEGQLQALRDGRADVMLEVDINLPEGVHTVAHFAARPFYFATTKGNTDLVSKLNTAILNIKETDPYFTVGLYEKYFGGADTELRLTKEEQAYIRGTNSVRVAVIPGRRPIQDICAENGEFTGVSREVFDYITKETGLGFQYVEVSSLDELVGMLDAGMVDMVSGMPYNYDIADICGVVMSRPYLTTQITVALARGVNAADLEGRRMARTVSGLASSGVTDNVEVYATMEECLAALDQGKADFACDGGYVMQYYANRGGYRNVTLVPQENATAKFCIGINKPVNVTLLNIVNKAIRSLPENELQNMIYRSAAVPVKVTLASFVADNLWPVLWCILAVSALVIILLLVYFRVRIRLADREALENERYRQLSELTNEHIFEYDYKRDRITLSERDAVELGMGRVLEHYRFQRQQDRSQAAERELAFFEQVTKDKSGTCELNITLPDGRQRWLRIAVKVISDNQGRSLLAIGRFTDIQSEREELERLAEKAQRDSLTGIYNAGAARQAVTRRLQERPGAGGALLVLDVDKFKAINDRYGHYVGDQALVGVARLLEDTFRSSDVVGRLGGDEFVVFVDRVTDRSVVEYKCRQIVDGMKELPGHLQEMGLTVSVGAVMARQGQNYDELYQLADKALYSVKKSSRNGYHLT